MTNSNPLPYKFCLEEYQAHPDQIKEWAKSNNPLLSGLAKEILDTAEAGK